MELKSRLDMLVSGGVIPKEVDAAVRAVIVRMADRWGIVLTEENGSRLVTHLAMALARVVRGESVSSMDRSALDEFRSCSRFEKAAEIIEDLEGHIRISMPDSEREFMIVNVCLILDAMDE